LIRPVAVVTGAGRGIGRATALELAASGHVVVAAARTLSDVVATADAAARLGGLIEPVGADIGTEPGVEAIFERAARLGTIRILVNNAASLERRDFISLPKTELEATLAVNLLGAFACSQLAYRSMRNAGGGCIVNIASLSGLQGVEKFPGLSAYVVSKFGLVGLTEALSVEGKPHGIRAVGLAPGAVDTALLRRAVPGLRAGVSPEEVARIIVFLASEAAAPLGGMVLPLLSNLPEPDA
jgi:NAD(P)-dependent dehydrogenase (short-subunit alcohol dehydrogenase family)